MNVIIIVCTIIILFIGAGSASAQDALSKYNAGCQTKNKTASFCSCALNAFSETMRKSDSKKLENLRRYYADVDTQLMADPALNEAKVDAVCDLYDEVRALDEQISKARYGTPQAREFTAQKLALMNKKEQLIISYGTSNNAASSLHQGRYCEYRADIARIEADMAADNGAIYPFVLRKLEFQPPYPTIFKAAYRSGCD